MAFLDFYKALIIFSSADVDEAHELQKELSHFRLCKKMKMEHPEWPNKGISVKSLSDYQLAEYYPRLLSDTHYLIVVCSPRTKNNPLIDRALNMFINAGRLTDIIPYVVEGTPFNSENECFPLPLRALPSDQILLGINIQEIGRKQAVVKVVANILQVKFSSLWRRQEREVSHTHRIWHIIVGLITLICFLIIQYNNTRVEYYADYYDVWGQPKGFCELSFDEIIHRRTSYKFEYEHIPFGQGNPFDWRLSRVVNINANGFTNSDNDKKQSSDLELYSIQDMGYDKDGRFTTVTYKNDKGKVMYRFVFSDLNGQKAAVADIWNEKMQNGTAYLDMSNHDSNILLGTLRVSRLAYLRDTLGYITQVTYHCDNSANLRNSAMKLQTGIYGYTLLRDELHRVVSKTYIDVDGNPTNDCYGLSQERYTYYSSLQADTTEAIIDDSLFVEKSESLKKTAQNFDFSAKIDVAFAEYFEISGWNVEGVPSLLSEKCHKKKYSYDEFGNILSMRYYGVDQKRGLMRDSVSRYEYRYDLNGNLTDRRSYDTDDEFCMSKFGYAHVNYVYNLQGDVKQMSFYDVNEQLCLSNNDYSQCKYEYDASRNATTWTYFDEKGRRTNRRGGYSRSQQTYDEHNNISSIAFFDTANRPIIQKQRGYAKRTMLRDAKGNNLEETFYDTEGQPMMNPLRGCATQKFKYDTFGNRTEMSFYDTLGNLCLDIQEVAMIRLVYNEQGFVIERTCYDVNEQPCYNLNGYFKSRYSYDARGLFTGSEFYDIQGNPIESKETHSARVVNLYDENGNLINTLYYDKEGRKIVNDVDTVTSFANVVKK